MKNLSSLTAICPGPTLLLDQENLPDESLMSSKSQSWKRSSAHSLARSRTTLPPLFSVEWRVRLRSPAMIVFSRFVKFSYHLIVSQQSFFSRILTREYTLKRLKISFVSIFYNFSSNQCMLLASKMTTYLLEFHSVPIPLETPLAEVALVSLLDHIFFLACKKTLSSSLVSWMRNMFGASILIKFLTASSLTLLLIPLQFQEMTFIIYISGGFPWSLGADFSTSLALRLAVFPKLASCPEGFPCRSAALFFLCLFYDLL